MWRSAPFAVRGPRVARTETQSAELFVLKRALKSTATWCGHPLKPQPSRRTLNFRIHPGPTRQCEHTHTHLMQGKPEMCQESSNIKLETHSHRAHAGTKDLPNSESQPGLSEPSDPRQERGRRGAGSSGARGPALGLRGRGGSQLGLSRPTGRRRPAPKPRPQNRASLWSRSQQVPVARLDRTPRNGGFRHLERGSSGA